MLFHCISEPLCNKEMRESSEEICVTQRFSLFLLQLVVLLGLLALCLWLVMRPHSPSYTIVDFSVPTSQADTNGTFSYTLEIDNPNRDSDIYYDDIFLTFYSNQDTVGQRKIDHFHQGKGKTLLYRDSMALDATIWRSLLKAISNKTAEMSVGAMTKIRYRTVGIKSKRKGMHLEGQIQIGTDGKISNKKKKVKLHSASKKWRLKLNHFG